MGPSRSAEASEPIKIAICMSRGVPPTRNPVLRSCDVVPPFDEAMQTMAPTDSAVTYQRLPVQPATRKMMQVNSSVATVIPEIGFDDEPISPVRRDGHGHEQEPEGDDEQRPQQVHVQRPRQGDRRDQNQDADEDEAHRQVVVGAQDFATAARRACPGPEIAQTFAQAVPDGGQRAPQADDAARRHRTGTDVEHVGAADVVGRHLGDGHGSGR
jgi:hypothetical protein